MNKKVIIIGFAGEGLAARAEILKRVSQKMGGAAVEMIECFEKVSASMRIANSSVVNYNQVMLSIEELKEPKKKSKYINKPRNNFKNNNLKYRKGNNNFKR